MPVELDARIDDPLPDEVEVAAYYVAAEALTNAAKHARASVVQMDVTTDDGTLTLMVRDDGVGGADPGEGSGLVGLQDRVEALGGSITIDSPAEPAPASRSHSRSDRARPGDRGTSSAPPRAGVTKAGGSA